MSTEKGKGHFSPDSEYGNQIENQRTDSSFQLVEIVEAILNQLIDRPRVEDWERITEFSKYTPDWLKNLWGQVFDQMILHEHKINGLSGEFFINYPFLYFGDRPVIKVEENTDCQIKIMDNAVIGILAKKFANELEIFEPELVKFFLTSIGVVKGGLCPEKAQELADDTIFAYGYGLPLNQAFRKLDLFILCKNYLSNWDNSINLKQYLTCDLVDRCRWALFPDVPSVYVQLPNLIGEPGGVQEARSLRHKKYVDLMIRARSFSRLLKRLSRQQKYPDTLLQPYGYRLRSYIVSIREKNYAKDWLSSDSTNYDRNWLRSQMKQFWEITQEEWKKQQCDLRQRYGIN